VLTREEQLIRACLKRLERWTTDFRRSVKRENKETCLFRTIWNLNRSSSTRNYDKICCFEQV